MASPEPPSRLPSDATCIGEILEFWNQHHPGHAALIFLDDEGGEQVTTYGQLRERARALGQHLLKICQPGDRAVLIFPPGKDFVTAFLGCLYAGVLAVPATEPKPRRPNDRLAAVAEDCAPSLVLCKREVLERIEIPVVCPALGDVPWICADDAAQDRSGASNGHARGPAPLPSLDRSSLAFLQYTSGSTSDPKGVAVSHGNLLNNLETIRQGFGQSFNLASDPARRGAFWLPPHHDMGLIGGILTPLYIGGTTIVMSPTSFLKRPLRWLEVISKYRGLISGAPNFAYDLCVEQLERLAQPPVLDLSCWQIAFCGAEPIRADTVDRFCAAFAPYGFDAQSFYPCYGMAESTLLVTGNAGRHGATIKEVDAAELQNHRIRAPRAAEASSTQPLRLVGCGRPLMGCEIRVVDPATRLPVAVDEVGEVWIRGDSVAQGYWQRPEQSEKTFRARLSEDGPERYLRTGDMGFIADEQLYITGRLKEMLVIRGRNFYPQDLEATASAADPSLPSSAAAAFSIEIDGAERLVLAQELDRRHKAEAHEDLLRRIRAALVQSHDINPAAVLLVRPFSLPRTTSGKMQRILCRQLYLDGQLKVLAQWQSPQRAASAAQPPETAPPDVPSNELPPPSDRYALSAPYSASDLDGGDGVGEPRISHLAEEIEPWLLQCLSECDVVEPEDVTPDRPLAELGLDSLAAVELATKIESRFGLTLNPIVVWNYPTPRHLARYLAAQITAGFEGPAPATPSRAAAGRFEKLLSQIESLDEEEVLRQLGRPGSHERRPLADP